MSVAPMALASIKHRATPGQINLKPHIKGLFTWVLLTQYNMSSFQQ